MTEKMRLDKFLAHKGIGSRKEVKELLKKGFVKINDTLCKSADTVVTELDKVEFDKKVLDFPSHKYFIFHKPAGYICSNEEGNLPTIFELILHPQKHKFQIKIRFASFLKFHF